MKKTLLVVSLLAATTAAMADQPGLTIDLQHPSGVVHQVEPLKSALLDGVLVTGATPSASYKDPTPVVIRLADGREVLGDAVYGTDKRYSVRLERVLGPGGSAVEGFMVDSKHIDGVRADKDGLLAPGTHVGLVDIG